jgi:hypothetical protein
MPPPLTLSVVIITVMQRTLSASWWRPVVRPFVLPVFLRMPLSPLRILMPVRWLASSSRGKKSSKKEKAGAQPSSFELQVQAQRHFDAAHEATKLGNLAEAETLLQQCLSLRIDALGENHDHVVSCLHALGRVYVYAGQATAAVPLLEQAVAAAAAVHGEHNAENQIPSLTLLAHALQMVTPPDFVRATTLLQRADEITQRKFTQSDHLQKARRLEERCVSI